MFIYVTSYIILTQFIELLTLKRLYRFKDNWDANCRTNIISSIFWTSSNRENLYIRKDINIYLYIFLLFERRYSNKMKNEDINLLLEFKQWKTVIRKYNGTIYIEIVDFWTEPKHCHWSNAYGDDNAFPRKLSRHLQPFYARSAKKSHEKTLFTIIIIYFFKWRCWFWPNFKSHISGFILRGGGCEL